MYLVILQGFTIYMFRDKWNNTAGYAVIGACLLNMIAAPIASFMSYKRDKFGGTFYESWQKKKRNDQSVIGAELNVFSILIIWTIEYFELFILLPAEVSRDFQTQWKSFWRWKNIYEPIFPFSTNQLFIFPYSRIYIQTQLILIHDPYCA